MTENTTDGELYNKYSCPDCENVTWVRADYIGRVWCGTCLPEQGNRMGRVRGEAGGGPPVTDSEGGVPPEGYELWDDEKEQYRCPFCDGRILRVGDYGECTECGEKFRRK